MIGRNSLFGPLDPAPDAGYTDPPARKVPPLSSVVRATSGLHAPAAALLGDCAVALLARVAAQLGASGAGVIGSTDASPESADTHAGARPASKTPHGRAEKLNTMGLPEEQWDARCT